MALGCAAGLAAALAAAVGTWSGQWWVAAPAGLLVGVGAWSWNRLACREREESLERLTERLRRIGGGSVEPDESFGSESPDEALEHLAQGLERKLSALERVLESLDAPVLAVDADGRVLLANEAMLGLLEAEADRVVGSRLEDLFTQADLIELQQRARAGAPAEGRIRLLRRQRTYLYEASARRTVLSGGEGVVLTLRDVTELAMAVQLKTDFVGNASHELRTPIAAIRAAIDTLIGPARDDGPMRERLVTMIRDSVLRLEDLVGDLLDLSRFESPEYEARLSEVDLPALCRELEEGTEAMRAPRGLGVECVVAENAARWQTDRSALSLILRNLLDNALKFSHDGGVVRLEAALDDDGDELVIRVIDRGIGIPLAQQQRIFERFYQVDQARSGSQPRRGTGLGLAIVKHALRRLGGSIDVDSIWQEGTTMTVRLPRSARGAVEAGARSGPPRLPEGV